MKRQEVNPTVHNLPEDFVFGVCTSAYQIEGAVAEDGRGKSIWDTFATQPGRIADGSSGEVTCDHYHRVAEDVALMSDLGLGGYRFSISWSRIQPTGRGPVNEPGLDFYDRLVDQLLAAGIAPMATLYHWDLPQPLQDQGGWGNRDTVEAYGDYAAIVAARLADRVKYWCPVNEPNVHMLSGHALGVHAPGENLMFGALGIGHNLLVAHGRGVAALRAAGADQIGTATHHAPVWVAGDTEEDAEAAQLYDAIHNSAFAQPVLAGSYPDWLESLLPIEDGDLAAISAPLDFYGMNYYNPMLVGRAGHVSKTARAAGFDEEAAAAVPLSLLDIEGYPTTDIGWPVVPDGLRELLLQFKQRYPNLPPVQVTENGLAHAPIDDPFRIEYLEGHLGAIAAATAEGVEVRGYWAWSLIDNWEWAEGFGPRFGLVHVDYETQARTPRKSYAWYRELIAQHASRHSRS